MDSSVVAQLAKTVLTPFSGLPFLTQLFIGTLALLSGWMLYNLTISPLSRYPGPLSARLGIPFWRFWHTLQGIGKDISLMELSKIIAEILLRYDIKKPIVAPTVQRHGATAGLGKSAKQPSFQGRSCWFLEAHVSSSCPFFLSSSSIEIGILTLNCPCCLLILKESLCRACTTQHSLMRGLYVALYEYSHETG